MKARPILFSGPMVRAILDGRKVQTRRIVKPQPCFDGRHGIYVWDKSKRHAVMANGSPTTEASLRRMLPRLSPYGTPGDVLWCRENGWERPERTPQMMREGADTWPAFEYDADGCNHQQLKAWSWKRRPSIHMPRWASRITLEIESIRVERLQDISEEDAIAEGCDNSTSEAARVVGWYEKPRRAFRRVWERINGNESWAANPRVWVVEFKPHLMNVDEFLKQREAA